MSYEYEIQWWYWQCRWLKRKKILAAILLDVILESEWKTERSAWAHPWVQRRKEKGVHHNLFMELSLEDPMRFRRCLRMDTTTFEDLVEKVAPYIRKRDTHLRESIKPDERLSVTLRHLATGESQESLSTYFWLGQSTISGIIRETVAALILVLRNNFLRFPTSEAEWKVVADDFSERRNFPNCIGAMDGKHCRIDPPLQSGSLFYNYKETFSVVLLAMVDPQLRFIFVDVGANGRQNDQGIWNRSTLKARLETNTLHLPEPRPLPGTSDCFPFVIVADEGFSLSNYVMIPYPGTQLRNRLDRSIFNYRLSRARRCSENAFGVLAARFQIYRAPMRYDPDVATQVVMATLCLHNMLRSSVVGKAMYTPPNLLTQRTANKVTSSLGSGDKFSQVDCLLWVTKVATDMQLVLWN